MKCNLKNPMNKSAFETIGLTSWCHYPLLNGASNLYEEVGERTRHEQKKKTNVIPFNSDNGQTVGGISLRTDVRVCLPLYFRSEFCSQLRWEYVVLVGAQLEQCMHMQMNVQLYTAQIIKIVHLWQSWRVFFLCFLRHHHRIIVKHWRVYLHWRLGWRVSKKWLPHSGRRSEWKKKLFQTLCYGYWMRGMNSCKLSLVVLHIAIS